MKKLLTGIAIMLAMASGLLLLLVAIAMTLDSDSIVEFFLCFAATSLIIFFCGSLAEYFCSESETEIKYSKNIRHSDMQ